MGEIKTLGGVLDGMKQSPNPISTPQGALSSIKLDARFEGILKIVSWTEMAVQIRLSDEQRAHLVRELSETELPGVMLLCASRILASGHVELFSRLDMAAWRKAIDQIPSQIGKINAYYRQGYRDGQQHIWHAIESGAYDTQLRNILDKHAREESESNDTTPED